MKIFDKRPLSLILCIVLGSFVFFTYIEFSIVKLTASIVLSVIFIITFIKPIKKRIKPAFTRIMIVTVLFSIIASYVYFDTWFKVYNRYQDEVTLEGTVTDIEKMAYQTSVEIKTKNINNDLLSSYRLKAYLDSDKYYGFSIGSKVTLTGKISRFSSENSNFDIESYYISQGIAGIITDVSDFSVIEVGDYTAEYKISLLKEEICRKIIYSSDSETGGLLCALLLGEKSRLPSGTQLAFSRIGISHILALSGMHLAILAIGLSKLLQFFRMGKKGSTVITALFTLVYMALTGFSISVTRAGIMLIVSSVLFLLSRTRDSLTSLFIAVTFICVLQPYSVYDISLWLSAFATLGIVVMSEFQSEKYSKPSFFRWIGTSLLASLFAISATFAITVINFDGISLIAPITTLVFSLIVEIFLYIGTALLFFGTFIPVRLLLFPIGQTIIQLSDWLSDFEWIYTSTNFYVVEFASVLFTVIFFSFFILDINHKKITITALAALLCSIFALSAILTFSNENKYGIDYYCTDNGEQIILRDNGILCAIDIADYDKTSAYDALSSINDSRLTRIDTYIHTHYSYDLEENIKTLLNSILINEIYLPTPQNEIENRIFDCVAEEIYEYQVKLHMYQKAELINIGRHTVYSLFNSEIGEKKKNVITIFSNEKLYTYINVDAFEGETKSMALETIAISDTIIFGRHESGSADYKFTYKPEHADTVIFSSDRIVMPPDILNFYTEKTIFFKPKKTNLTR